MTLALLHISTADGNPGCGEKDDKARLTSSPELVSCKRCRLSAAFRRARKAQAWKPNRRLTSYAGVAVRAHASLYLRRALRIIEQLPMRRVP